MTRDETRTRSFHTVGHSERKVDGVSLVTGKPTFVADIDLPNTLHVRLLTSPHPHARISRIDTSAAEAIAGVVCVLTHKNTPATRYTTAGQGSQSVSGWSVGEVVNSYQYEVSAQHANGDSQVWIVPFTRV